MEKCFLEKNGSSQIGPYSPFRSKISGEREGADAVNCDEGIAGTLFPRSNLLQMPPRSRKGEMNRSEKEKGK